MRSADRLERAFLQHPQQFDLGFEGNIADFIEKECAPVSHLKSPGSVAMGAGVGPFHVAEQLTLVQTGASCPTMDADDRSASTRAVFMDRLGEQLFAGAALAADQNRRLTVGDFPDRLQNLSDCRAAPFDQTATKRIGLLARASSPCRPVISDCSIEICRCCSAIFSTLSRSS